METFQEDRLISHGSAATDIKTIVDSIAERIQKEGDKPYVTVSRQLELLNQLTEFELGIFLLKNKGLNGFWTDHIITYPWRNRYNDNKLTSLEKILLERLPAALAIQQRFTFFLKENQKCVQNNRRLACIPSGLMGELLYLNYDAIQEIELFGIDYDPDTLKDAKLLAQKLNLSHFSKFVAADAWHLNYKNDFDLISSNGLNIYEPDDEKIAELYAGFYKALKPGGKLVTSFLTFPPNFPDKCEWNMEKINKDDLLLQKIIFVDIIGAKWQSYRTMEQTKTQLEQVGFSEIEFMADLTNQFPTVVAYKM